MTNIPYIKIVPQNNAGHVLTIIDKKRTDGKSDNNIICHKPHAIIKAINYKNFFIEL